MLVGEKEKESQKPGFWDDPRSAEELLKSISQLKSWTEQFTKVNTAIDDLVVIYDFFREGEATEEDLEKQYDSALLMMEDLELRNMLQKDEDELSAILKINSGAGGTESNDWAQCS